MSSKAIESPEVKNQNEVDAAAIAVRDAKLKALADARKLVADADAELTLGDRLADLLKGQIPFSALRSAACELGRTASRDKEGNVKSVSPVKRAIYLALFSAYGLNAGKFASGQLLELSALSRTMDEFGAKSEGSGAIYFAEGKVSGDAAGLGSVKVRPAGKVGNVELS